MPHYNPLPSAKGDLSIMFCNGFASLMVSDSYDRPQMRQLIFHSCHVWMVTAKKGGGRFGGEISLKIHKQNKDSNFEHF